MIFQPQQYNIPDEKSRPFVDPAEIRELLTKYANPSLEQVQAVVERSLSLQRLSLEETAILLSATSPEASRLITESARKLKQEVYGERIVIFAPLYIGNRCVNNCAYCGFRASNKAAMRVTLNTEQIHAEVEALERQGQKRLILVYGEHPDYSAEYIASTVREVYSTHTEKGQINRVNINAAPFDVDGFRTIQEAGIGTYQIFQETYDPQTYSRVHLGGKKADYDWRLTALDRAMEAGIDDVGLGVLFGLGEWRFEVMALVRHVNHLEACFGVGPHTISFPRLQKASNVSPGDFNPVSDEDFTRLVAVLRLAVPYTGMILTAREPQQLRDKLIDLGVSQIDAGTKLELGAYAQSGTPQNLDREQFELMDGRTLAEAVETLVDSGQIPSFCTACYRKGRTGEHFMEFSVKGFIKRFCAPNALLTLAEYLEDYAAPELREKGWQLIHSKLPTLPENIRPKIEASLAEIRAGRRDVFL